jgi:hypothetical protein
MSTITKPIYQTVTLGSGVYLSPLTITSTGEILVPIGGGTGLLVPANVSGASIVNQGYIIGGMGGGPVDHHAVVGGTGADLESAATLTNGGLIRGNHGGDGWVFGGTGGGGVVLANGGALRNAGEIDGGVGGTGTAIFQHSFGYGGIGGNGVDMASGETLTNTGIIAGGAGGVDYGFAGGFYGQGGSGGAGVYLNGGTLITSGTITGGAGGSGNVAGAPGVAVQFGTVAATLVVDPGAVFNGQVAAGAADVLQLAGNTAGTLSGLGSNFTNFNTIDVNAGAKWTLSGANSLAGPSTVTIGNGGHLAIGGSLDVSGTVEVSGTGSLTNAGTLAETGSGEVKIETTFINSAAVSIGSGKMDFLSSVGGTGTIGIASGATAALLHGAAATQHLNFQVATGQATTGELDLGKPATFLGTIAGFGSMDKTDLLSTPATTLAFAGGKLTVDNGTTVVATLAFSGVYSNSTFALSSDGHGGSLITFV